MSSTEPSTPCDCGSHGHCILTAKYWDDIYNFAQRTSHRFIFGLNADLQQASHLIQYAAENSQQMFAYSFTNELVDPSIISGLKQLRTVVDNISSSIRPLLIGPDLALQRHAPLAVYDAGNDDTVTSKLAWLTTYVSGVADAVDAVSWHTYDFHADEVGTVDHQPWHPESVNASRLYNVSYLNVAGQLAQHVGGIAQAHAPHAAVWLSETDSICHQGVANATNAYINSLWLLHRLGVMIANTNTTLMARQSLIGYNYSLLGNYPVEPIAPNPDYFTTVLFRQLVGSQLFPLQPQLNTAFQIFMYDAAQDPSLRTLVFINLDATEVLQYSNPGSCEVYVLSPVSEAAYPYTSRTMALNGKVLRTSAEGALPPLSGLEQRECNLDIAPLTFAFAVMVVPET